MYQESKRRDGYISLEVSPYLARDTQGTLLGLVLLAMIGPALTFLGVSAYWERAIQGVIILAAVAGDAVRARSRRYAG